MLRCLFSFLAKGPAMAEGFGHSVCVGKQTRRWLGAALCMVLCGGHSLEAGPRYGGKITIGMPGGIAPLNPITTYSTVAVNVFDILFERFLKESVSGEIVPGIAISWTPSEDYRTWDFKLREDVKFHDGTLVRAEDVVFTFRLSQQHRTGESWGGGLPPLRFESIEAVAPDTVRIHFSEPPNASFLYQMREHILPRHVVEPQLETGKSLKEIPFNRHPVGAGPFQLESWEGEAKIVSDRKLHVDR